MKLGIFLFVAVLFTLAWTHSMQEHELEKDIETFLNDLKHMQAHFERQLKRHQNYGKKLQKRINHLTRSNENTAKYNQYLRMLTSWGKKVRTIPFEQVKQNPAPVVPVVPVVQDPSGSGVGSGTAPGSDGSGGSVGSSSGSVTGAGSSQGSVGSVGSGTGSAAGSGTTEESAGTGSSTGSVGSGTASSTTGSGTSGSGSPSAGSGSTVEAITSPTDPQSVTKTMSTLIGAVQKSGSGKMAFVNTILFGLIMMLLI